MIFTNYLNKYRWLEFILKILLIPPLKFILIFKKYKKENESILVISVNKLGDTVLTIPAVNILYEKYKDKLYILCYKYLKAIYEFNFPEAKILPIEKEQILFGGRIFKFWEKTRHNSTKFNTIYDLTGTILSVTIILRYSFNRIIGYNEKYFSSIYHKFISRQNLSKLKLSEAYLAVIFLDERLSKKINTGPKSFNFKPGGSIFIHSSAGWQAKEWGNKSFIELAERLKNSNYKVKFITEKKYFSSELREYLKKQGLEILETQSTEELMKYLDACSLIISNDTGPIHLASMLGCATFTIFGPTNPELHVSNGKIHRYIQSEINCSPKGSEKYCFTFGGRIGCPSNECMKLISVNSVFNEIINFCNYLGIEKSNN